MEAVKELTHDFMRATGLSFTYYKRTYAEQSICFSTNNAAVLGAVFDKVLPEIVTKEMTATHLFDFLWDEYFCPDTIAMIEESYSLFHGLCTLRFYRTHYDVFAVGHDEKISLSSSFYLSHLQLIHDFQENLTKRVNMFAKRKSHSAPAIIDLGDAHVDVSINAGSTNGDGAHENFEPFTLDIQQKYPLYDAFSQPTHLTALEFLSVHLFSQGKPYKSIALLLDISPRTVETYITRAKERTGYLNKYDILNAVRYFKTSHSEEKDDRKTNQLSIG